MPRLAILRPWFRSAPTQPPACRPSTDWQPPSQSSEQSVQTPLARKKRGFSLGHDPAQKRRDSGTKREVVGFGSEKMVYSYRNQPANQVVIKEQWKEHRGRHLNGMGIIKEERYLCSDVLEGLLPQSLFQKLYRVEHYRSRKKNITRSKAYMLRADGDMLDYFQQKPSLSEKIRVMTHLARQVALWHERGTVHLDIKPQNILIYKLRDQAVTPVLIDFGFAQDARASLHHLRGTAYYLAPEMVREFMEQDGAKGLYLRTADNDPAPYLQAVDVYAFGETLVELALGQRPTYQGLQTQLIDQLDLPEGKLRPGTIDDLLKEHDPSREIANLLQTDVFLEKEEASLLKIAQSAMAQDPLKRSSMQRVLQQLSELEASLESRP